MELLKGKFQPIIAMLMVIWVVEIINFFLGHRLTNWGIFPRSLGGLVGIPLAPVIHASLWHAVSNTIPLAILGGLTLAAGTNRFWTVTVGVTILSGLLVWLFARSAFHVGASGLVFGYFGVILATAFFKRTILSIIIAIASITLYGGLLWGVLPVRSYISFEAHLFGLIAGIIIAWLDHSFAKPDV